MRRCSGMNNVAENITLSDPDRLLERINQDLSLIHI